MHGADDELTIGERGAFYRRRRGLAQRELAGLVGRSEEWVSSVERGRRQVRRLDVLVVVAEALRSDFRTCWGSPCSWRTTKVTTTSGTAERSIERVKVTYADAGWEARTKAALVHRAVQDGMLPVVTRPRSAS